MGQTTEHCNSFYWTGVAKVCYEAQKTMKQMTASEYDKATTEEQMDS
jgi:hypothetical protein